MKRKAQPRNTGPTPKQKKFIKEYLIDLNATGAAKRAGYSKHTALKQGPRLLSNVVVAAEIQAALDKRAEKVGVSAERVIQELMRVAMSDIKDFVEWGPTGVLLAESAALGADKTAAVSEVSETLGTISGGGGSKKFKLHDKVRALELLGKHLGMFREKIELTGKDGAPVEINAGQLARERVSGGIARIAERRRLGAGS